MYVCMYVETPDHQTILCRCLLAHTKYLKIIYTPYNVFSLPLINEAARLYDLNFRADSTAIFSPCSRQNQYKFYTKPVTRNTMSSDRIFGSEDLFHAIDSCKIVLSRGSSIGSTNEHSQWTEKEAYEIDKSNKKRSTKATTK